MNITSIVEKIKSIWTKVQTIKPKFITYAEKLYKAIYVLNSVLTSAGETATALGMDTATLAKVSMYVSKINTYMQSLAGQFGITLGASFTDEVNTLVTSSTKALPRSAAKRAKLTVADVIKNYDDAFAVIDDILAD